MDNNLVPKTFYCYDDNGVCPYWREDKSIKVDLYGYGHIPSVWCDLLKVNSAALDFNGDSYHAHLLQDMCKICDLHRK